MISEFWTTLEWLFIIFSTSNNCFHRLLSVSMPSVEAAFRNGYVGNPHALLTGKLLPLHSWGQYLEYWETYYQGIALLSVYKENMFWQN